MLVYIEVDGAKTSVSLPVSDSIEYDYKIQDVVTECKKKYGHRDHYIVKFKGELIERYKAIPDTTSQDPIHLISEMSKLI